MKSPVRRRIILAQLVFGCAVMLLIAVWPPRRGAMLLLPVMPGDAGMVARAAIDGGAALSGPGVLRGSIVVIGDRARIAAQARRPIVILAASPAGCAKSKRWRRDA